MSILGLQIIIFVQQKKKNLCVISDFALFLVNTNEFYFKKGFPQMIILEDQLLYLFFLL